MTVRAVIFAFVLGLAMAGSASAKDAQALNQIAKTYQRGEVVQTITALKPYLAAHPDDDLGWVFLGHARYDTNEYAEAEAAYKHAVQLNAKRVEALTGLGMVASKLKKYDEAIKWYEQAIALNPNYAQAYSSMITIALKKGDYKKAVSLGEKSIQLDHSDPMIAANLAIAYHFDKQIEARDKMANTAASLGYKNMGKLLEIFEGKWDFRD